MNNAQTKYYELLKKLHNVFLSLNLDMDDIAACMDALIIKHGAHFSDYYHLLNKAEEAGDEKFKSELEYSDETEECFYEAINSQSCSSFDTFTAKCKKYLSFQN